VGTSLKAIIAAQALRVAMNEVLRINASLTVTVAGRDAQATQ
jgi:hypothetical protein